MSSSLRILLVKANMGYEEADVIVNSTNPNLDLHRGHLSKALLDRAGPKLQQDCRDKYPDGISIGDIAVTKAGDLKWVEDIYHCVLPRWDEATGVEFSFRRFGGPERTWGYCRVVWGGSLVGDIVVEELETFAEHHLQTFVGTVTKLLTLVHNSHWKTMAIPALGTGRLAYPKDLIAQLMYDTVTQFGRDHTDTSINDVLFVCHPSDKDTIKAFNVEHRKYVAAIGGKITEEMEEQQITKYREQQMANISHRKPQQ